MPRHEEEWDAYIERLTEEGNAGALFIEHLERLHDSIMTAQRIAASRFGAAAQNDKEIVLTITNWILTGPAPWDQ